MTQVVTFENFEPIARYDSVPWTLAQIQEATSQTGSWTTIDTITLSPVDANPANPADRNLTTALASSTAGLWYRIVFVDGSGRSSLPTSPVQNNTGGVKATALTTLGAAREYVLRDAADDTQDSQLIRLINAYSSAIFAYTQREWLPAVTTTRQFVYDGSGFLSLEPFEARTITSITLYSDLPTADQRVLVAGSSSVESEFRLMPPNQTAQSTYQWIELPNAGRIGLPAWWNNPYPFGPVGRAIPAYFQASVLADWGIGSIPDDVELACLIAVDDAYKNPTGFSSGQVGGESFTEIADTTFGGEARARNLPVEARALLTPYKRGSTVVAV